MATMLSSVRANMDRQGLKELERLLFEFKIANFYHRNNPSAPVSVTLYLHARCNLNCSMCWRNADFAAERLKQKEVPLSRWEKTIVELAEMGCRSIKFSGGGEPLLYPVF
jgi:MoaA/NifB/PqqE/SkfB family radical SAM enzyme